MSAETVAKALLRRKVIRDSYGSRSLCHAMHGQQHLKTCQLWPLINARIDHHLPEEAQDPRSQCCGDRP